MSKGLEELKEIKYMLDAPYTSGIIKQGFEIIEKELKALEIIKPLVHLTKDANGCWLWLGLNAVQITQEQYDSLKKVLP